jgi:hypothetical protein
MHWCMDLVYTERRQFYVSTGGALVYWEPSARVKLSKLKLR